MSSKKPTSSPPASGSEPAAPCRCGYIVLTGRPNAGKSTLFNALIGERLSIVTPKPQTTRHRILGILTRPHSQFVFLDTPGLLEPHYKLHQTMERQIELATRQADLALFLLDAVQPRDRLELARGFLRQVRIPVIAVLNKIDLISPDQVEDERQSLRAELGLETLLPVSAVRGDRLAELLELVEARLPFGPRLYPEEMLTEHPERFFVSEFIREAAINQLEDELPYALNVVVETFAERPGKTYISAVLHVERDTQKGIVIGRGGRRLRDIGTQARRQIELLLGAPVYLELRVKVRPDWRRKEKDLKEFGYL
jgi:GTPase